MASIIDMPKLSDTMTVGTLVKWLKKEGDPVKSGDMLAEVETDKATMELESFYEGTLLKIFAQPGSQVAIGAPLAAVGKPGETVPEPAASPAAAAPAPAPIAAQPIPAPAPAVSVPAVPAAAPSTNGSRVKISPLARKVATDKGVDFSRLLGSGPGGRIVKADVLAAAEGKGKFTAAPTAASGAGFTGGVPAKTGPIQEDKVVPVSTMRGVIAKRLLESKTQIPHFYVDIEVDAGPLLELRQQLNSGLEKDGVKLSVNDFILKASAEALRRVPAVNCSWEGTAVRHFGSAHVSFAVAIEDGLITPVIRNAHAKSIFAISTEAKSLGKRAKEKKLKPDEFTGGTFCVSNLGMMGIDRFCAIINPPNVAILAVGATVKKPVVKDDQIVIGQRMTLTLSADHRVVDGAVGAQFLSALRDLVEKPALLLV
ncbi:MAG TPA: pyruvate dehydrogenase complex dihydrolipoamide acetyltransferase [Opitutaceae bacterium]|nr:pyruvate dehydrogenase complex dihydrolipoamide acetyltransferase [Opitutaceae bacterium]